MRCHHICCPPLIEIPGSATGVNLAVLANLPKLMGRNLPKQTVLSIFVGLEQTSTNTRSLSLLQTREQQVQHQKLIRIPTWCKSRWDTTNPSLAFQAGGRYRAFIQIDVLKPRGEQATAAMELLVTPFLYIQISTDLCFRLLPFWIGLLQRPSIPKADQFLREQK